MAAAKGKKANGTNNAAKPPASGATSTKLSEEASAALLGVAPDATKLPEALKANAPVEGTTAGVPGSNDAAGHVSRAQVLVTKRIKALTKKLQRMESYLNAAPETLDANQKKSLASRSVMEAVVAELQEVVKQLAATESEQKASTDADKKVQIEVAAAVARDEAPSHQSLQRSFFALHSYIADRAGWSGAPPSFAPRSVPAALENISGDTTQAIRILFLRLTALPTSDDVASAAAEGEMERRLQDAQRALDSLVNSSNEAIVPRLTPTYSQVVDLIKALEKPSAPAVAASEPAPLVNGSLHQEDVTQSSLNAAQDGVNSHGRASNGISFLQASEVGTSNPGEYNAPVPILQPGTGPSGVLAPSTSETAPEGGAAGDLEPQPHVSAADPASGASESVNVVAEAGQQDEVQTNGKAAADTPKFNWADDEGDDLDEPPAEWSTPATVAGTPARAASGTATPQISAPTVSAAVSQKVAAVQADAAPSGMPANGQAPADSSAAPTIDAKGVRTSAAQTPNRPNDPRRPARIPQVDDDGFEQVVSRKNVRANANERGGYAGRGGRGDFRARGKGGDARGRGRGGASGGWVPPAPGDHQGHHLGAQRGRGQTQGQQMRDRGRGGPDGSAAAALR
ncbi:hypothetical protein IE81DRAFT_365760 [Ceraceosorus guamensis]|uniref:Uncharacterized protein n=1 Tax=Ceraceosorus guamensis TaxID=1522189 RepID=A0A316W156_9BASI|nr:hypothetical protein IE81DRAFT_365760 [Ceraceosorus guamensis]PWN43540.1 hypothetical protein IE81DRAFT_365760 [Ceraceosorus guamensis]